MTATAIDPTTISKRAPVAPDTRVKAQFGIRDIFKIDLGPKRDPNKVGPDGKFLPELDVNGQPVPREILVDGYSEPGEYTPKIDPAYVFQPDETRAMLLGMGLKDNILLVGHTGVGKTSLVKQIAARLNYNFVRFNFDGCITRADLVGEYVLVGKETRFQYGLLAKVFTVPGTIILLDEWDTISGECAFVLQRPLERDDRTLLIMENGGEQIPMHPDNVLVASSNTAGQGDPTGMYTQGTKVQNYAQLNRFSMTIRLDYLKAPQEQQMIAARFPQLTTKEVAFFVSTINLVREAYQRGEMNAPLSTRDLHNWVEKFQCMDDPMIAAKYSFMNRATPNDATTIENIIQRRMDPTKK